MQRLEQAPSLRFDPLFNEEIGWENGRMEKAPPELSILEIARLLCGKERAGGARGACVRRVANFLLRAARPYQPGRIGKRHDLIVFLSGNAEECRAMAARLRRERPALGSTEGGFGMENAHRIMVGRDYFFHMIRATHGRYPTIKKHYRKNPFWGEAEQGG